MVMPAMMIAKSETNWLMIAGLAIGGLALGYGAYRLTKGVAALNPIGAVKDAAGVIGDVANVATNVVTAPVKVVSDAGEFLYREGGGAVDTTLNKLGITNPVKPIELRPGDVGKRPVSMITYSLPDGTPITSQTVVKNTYVIPNASKNSGWELDDGTTTKKPFVRKTSTGEYVTVGAFGDYDQAYSQFHPINLLNFSVNNTATPTIVPAHGMIPIAKVQKVM
jgi:hypothetical protein